MRPSQMPYRGNRTPKDMQLSHTMDVSTYALLEAIAAEEFDGNRSLTIRKVLREAAERRGIAPDGKPAAEQTGEVQDERVTA